MDRLPRRALNVVRNGTQKVTQRKGIDAVCPHHHLDQWVIQQFVKVRFAAEFRHEFAPQKLKSISGIDKYS